MFSGLPAGTYTVLVVDINTCSTVTAPVTIVPPPALTLAINVISNYNGRDISCNGASDGRVEALVTGGTGGYTYMWYSDAAMTLPIGQIAPVAQNLAAGTYYLRVRDANGCTIDGSVVLTQPDALDAVITTQADADCFGAFTGSLTVAAVAGSGTPPYEYSINGGSSWQATGVFTNLAANNYTVLVRDINLCVKPVPVIISQPTQLTASISALTHVSCNGGNDASVTITVTAGAGTTPYTFSIDGGTTWQPDGIFSGLTAGTYSVIVTDNNGCSITVPVMITEPTLLVMTKTADVLLSCFGYTTGTGTFMATGGTPGYSFTIVENTTGALIPAQGFNSQSFFNAGAGMIVVRVTDSKGCEVQDTIFIAQPDDLTPGSIAGDQVLCAGQNPGIITQVLAPTGGPGAFIYQWQSAISDVGPFFNIAGANSAEYTPPANATTTQYYRRMITSGLCAPVYSNVIEKIVNPLPVAILTGGETICPGETAILYVNLPIGQAPFELQIENWGIVSNYQSDDPIIVNPMATTTYRLLRVTDANGCEVLSPSMNLLGQATIVVRALPVITDHPIDVTICEYGIVTFNVAATGDDLTYQWYVNDGTTIQALTDGGTYFGANSPMLMLFGPTRLMNGYRFYAEVSGCGVTVTSNVATLTVDQVAEIIAQPRDSTICMDDPVSFTVDATGTNLVYEWQVKIGAANFVPVINDGNITGANSATLSIASVPGSYNNYIFRVRVSGTCGAPIFSNFAFLRVQLPPVPTINPSNRTVCAEGGPVYFVANGTGVIDSIRWQVSVDGVSWNDIYDNEIYSGTTSQQLALVGIPLAYNGYRYRLALKAFCLTSYTQPATLTVNSLPVVDFSAIDPVDVCGGVPLMLNGNPSGGSGVYTQHRWMGDIGPLSSFTSQTPTFYTTLEGVYVLAYTVTDNNGCRGSDTLTVRVEKPFAMFVPSVASGCTDLEVTFDNTMSTGYTSIFWDFGDGFTSTADNPTHTFVNGTTSLQYYDVRMRITSATGCQDSMRIGITVYPQMNSAFTLSADTICSGETVTLISDPGALQYYWVYGDGDARYSLSIDRHMYLNLTENPVTHTITLTTTSLFLCESTTSRDIVVYPMPKAEFTASPPLQTWPAATVSFTNLTNSGNFSYLWRFGDGNTSTAYEPTYTYGAPGNYMVTLIVSNDRCIDSISHPVQVLPTPPIASFGYIESDCGPLTVTLSNTSQYATTYLWDFGDGGASTAANPTYTWTVAGTYRVTLIAYGPGGQSVYDQIIEVYQTPVAYFQFAPEKVYVNDERVRFFNLSQYAETYIWHFGDGDTSHVKDPFHKYMVKGIFDVTLHAYKFYTTQSGAVKACVGTYVASPGVLVEPAGVIRFATAFIPNKTGPQPDATPTPSTIDQFFFPPVTEQVDKYKLQIFNRWGVLIFQSTDIMKGWDGYYKGKLVKQGVYVWLVEGKYSNGKPFRMSGDVTVLH